MPTLKNAVKLTAIAAAMTFASQASAHEPYEWTKTMAPIGGGGSYTQMLKCPAHTYVISGGVKAMDQLNPDGPLVVTASYPANTRTWAVTLTNRSGRPTGAQEATITFVALCRYRH